MFLGTYTFAIDPKSRVSVPVEFRRYLSGAEGERVVLVKHREPCLLGFPAALYREMVVAKLDALPLFDPGATRLRRYLIGDAYEMALDAQGRVLIPDKLRMHAGLGGKAMFRGSGRTFEIWAGEEHEGPPEGDGAGIGELLAGFGL